MSQQQEIAKIRQDRDAQFAHNTALLARIAELEEDGDFHNRYLARLSKLLNNSPDGHITFNLTERVQALLVAIQQAWTAARAFQPCDLDGRPSSHTDYLQCPTCAKYNHQAHDADCPLGQVVAALAAVVAPFREPR